MLSHDFLQRDTRRRPRTHRSLQFQDLWLKSRATTAAHFDRDLGDLPEGLRWREWMGRVEAAIFASPTPVSRETLARLVGDACRLDDLLADIATELRARPYEIVFVAGGYHFRTRPRHAEALRSLAGTKDAGPP
jgi:segregation and condensation protein B